MFNSVLMVCVGNICRSPMAEYLLKDVVAREKRALRVESAGIGALVGKPADPHTLQLLAERGVDGAPHRARQLDGSLLREFDLVWVMEKWQKREIEAEHPSSRGRVYTIGHWGDFEVPDPYQKDEKAFREAMALIEKGLDQWRTRI